VVAVLSGIAGLIGVHVAGALDGPFIVLFEQQRANETDDGVVVGEDADDVGSPLDLAVRVRRRRGWRWPSPPDCWA
jgi:hypothetical protein